MFLNKIRNIFVSRVQNLCPQQMLRAGANGETFVSAAIHLIPKWRRPRIVWVELHENEASRATEQKNSLRQRCVLSSSGPSFLKEDDIRGSSLHGRAANPLKNSELKFWLKCRGDSCEELSTKAQLCKR